MALNKEQKKLGSNYSSTFTTPYGAEVLEDLKKVFYNCSSFVKSEPYSTAFLEGQRHVVLYIMGKMLLKEAPKNLPTVETEA